MCFENYLVVLCSHRQSRRRMKNTFIIVNITPTCIGQIQKRPSFSFQFGQKENILGHPFEKYLGFPYSQSRNRKRMVNTLLMVYRIDLCWELIFMLCKKKNRNLICISSKQRTFEHFTHRFSMKKLLKNTLWWNKLWNIFFHRSSNKIAISVSWCTAPVSWC